MNVASSVTDAFASLAAPARALLVSVAGAAVAWLWFDGRRALAVACLLAALAVGVGVDLLGRYATTARPVAAVALMEWWILVPMTLAAGAASAAIVVTVELALPDGSPAATKETVGAVATAVTAFLASGFVDRAADEDGSRVSERVRDHLRARYDASAAVGSPQERALYSAFFEGEEGWGRAARRRRAAALSPATRSTRAARR